MDKPFFPGMKTSLSLCILLLFGSALNPSMAQQASSLDLNEFKWKNRLVLLFAFNQQDEGLNAFELAVKQAPEDFLDRDMILFKILKEGPSTVGTQALSPESGAKIREQLRVYSDSFSVYLVGKDGTVKLKGDASTSLSEIFALIDTMPMRRNEIMRRNEMRQKNQ